MAEAVVTSAETRSQVEVPARRTIHVRREMGLWGVFIFAISSIGLVYSGMLPFSTLAGMWPGADLAAMIAIGGLFALLLTYTFAAMGVIAPRFGADYLVASRVISPPLAFAASWTLVIFLAMAAGSIMAMIAQTMVPIISRVFALVAYDNSLVSLAAWISSPSGTITLGTAGIVLIFLGLFLPPSVTHRVLLVGTLAAVAAWVVMGVILADANPTGFQTTWDQWMGSGDFSEKLILAQQMRMEVDPSTGTLWIAGFMLSLWVFSGVFNPVYLAGEVKAPKKNLLAGSLMALVAAVALLAAVTYLLQRLVPIEWLSAQSFLAHNGVTAEVARPWLPLYVSILHPDGLLVRALGLAWVISLFSMTHTMLYTSSRIMLAWAEDHLLPQAASFIHPELRSPIIPVLVACLLAVLGIVEVALNSGINNRINAVFFFAGVQLLPVLGITLLPFRQRKWFESATGFVRAQIGPLPVITLVGGLSLLYLIATIAALVIWPGYNPLNADTFLWFVVMFGSGLLWFYARRWILSVQGQDIDPLLRSAPVEDTREDALQAETLQGK